MLCKLVYTASLQYTANAVAVHSSLTHQLKLHVTVIGCYKSHMYHPISGALSTDYAEDMPGSRNECLKLTSAFSQWAYSK